MSRLKPSFSTTEDGRKSLQTKVAMSSVISTARGESAGNVSDSLSFFCFGRDSLLSEANVSVG